MSNKTFRASEMVAKSKYKVVSCSTPEPQLDSPSHDSDSEAASPVPYLCTQDGAEGDTDVVWNFYSPTSKETNTHFKSTPVRKVKRTTRTKLLEKPPPKRRMIKLSQRKTELFQGLIELNQNLHDLIPKKAIPKVEKPQSEEDMFSDSDSSPRSTVKSKNRCLRKNVLSSKFIKTDNESGLESDDSINECLIKASQLVEEKLLYEPKPAKKPCLENIAKTLKPSLNVNIDQDSIDAILCDIKLESPLVNKVKKSDSPRRNNDTFDSFLEGLNDSAMEKLSQMPVNNDSSVKRPNVKENTNSSKLNIKLCEESPSAKSTFGRHNSMPESPSLTNSNKPSTSGMVFGRYNSMPLNKSNEKITVPGNSPIRCTPDEIKRKHQQAREKLLAKRLLPFTSQQKSQPPSVPVQNIPNNNNKQIFQYKVRTSNKIIAKSNADQKPSIETNLKSLIEKKRQEALMKLRRRQPQHKLS